MVTFGPGPGPSVPVACLVERVLTPPVPPLAAPPAAGLLPAGPVAVLAATIPAPLNWPAREVAATCGWPLLFDACIAGLVLAVF